MTGWINAPREARDHGRLSTSFLHQLARLISLPNLRVYRQNYSRSPFRTDRLPPPTDPVEDPSLVLSRLPPENPRSCGLVSGLVGVKPLPLRPRCPYRCYLRGYSSYKGNTMFHYHSIARTIRPSFVTQVVTIQIDPPFLGRGGFQLFRQTYPSRVSGSCPYRPPLLLSRRVVHKQDPRRRPIAGSGKPNGTYQPITFELLSK